MEKIHDFFERSGQSLFKFNDIEATSEQLTALIRHC